MNRDIKFRAWDSHNKRMIPHALLDCGIKNINKKGVMYNTFLTFLQYTGLKDKNDNEIYEGDLLATSNDNEQFDFWRKEDNGYTEVIWDSVYDCWHGSLWQWTKWDESVYCLKFIEVIGNIYENPELIKN